MLGVAADDTLVRACEERLGRVVAVASTFDLRQLVVSSGILLPRKPKRIVLALTDRDIWLLDIRDRVVSFSLGSVLGHLPRQGVVANWRRSWLAWPTIWRAEFSWPELSTYIEGSFVACNDTEALMGLITADEFDRELGRAAPAPG